MRLNKFLAACGLGSRRGVEELVFQGNVRVDGEVVTSPGIRLSPEAHVCVCGKRVFLQRKIYAVFHKPEGYVCSLSDPHNTTIYSILPESFLATDRLFPVGRLDKNSSGLLLLTNDGDFSQEISHPRHGKSKTYEVLLKKTLSEEVLCSWRKGVVLEGKNRVPLALDVMERSPQGRWIRIVLQEGLKREIRLMVQHYGNTTLVLQRRAIGKLYLRKLAPGKFRTFSKEQLWCMIHNGGSV